MCRVISWVLLLHLLHSSLPIEHRQQSSPFPISGRIRAASTTQVATRGLGWCGGRREHHLRLRGGGVDIDEGDVAAEWEIAEGFDDVRNTFSYLRNKRHGQIIELNHVRCGGFRIAPAGGQEPRWAFAGGAMLPASAPESQWRCPSVPDAFMAATGGGHGGSVSQRMYEFDLAESDRRWCDSSEIEAGFTAGNVTVWPGSLESEGLTERLRRDGLVFRDVPHLAKDTSMLNLPEDEDEDEVTDPLEVDPKERDCINIIKRHDRNINDAFNAGWQARVSQGMINIKHENNPEAQLFLCDDGVIFLSCVDVSNRHMGGGWSILGSEEEPSMLSHEGVTQLLSSLGYEYQRDPAIDTYMQTHRVSEGDEEDEEEALAREVLIPHPFDQRMPPIEDRFRHTDDPKMKKSYARYWEAATSSTDSSEIFQPTSGIFT